MQVLTDDGVALHVEVDELEGAELTVLFSHGFTAQLGEFELQRAALAGRARLVLYDQRGHGRSGRSGWRGATIDQLGRDLQAVLDATTPAGPVILFGHSMGGMTLMSWARQHPGQVGSRVVGAFLLATSAGDLVQTGPIAAGVQLLTRLHLLPVLFAWLRLISPLIERVRKPGTRVGRAYIRHYLFGTDDAGDPELVTRVAAMLEATPFTTTALFYPTFITHDERDSLSVLRRIPTTVLCGSSDRLTPVAHSRAMATALGDSTELVVVPGAGHSVNITRQHVVDDALLRLLDRAVPWQDLAAG
jgi:pimeloyl-ACP methyl ester carboxylesterase